jgi:hypothetical protein
MRGGTEHPIGPAGPPRWLEQRVQLSGGRWMSDDRAGGVRTSGWWESATLTWSYGQASERSPAARRRALAVALERLGPPLAELLAAGARRLLERQPRVRAAVVSLRRELPSAVRQLASPDKRQ